YSCSLTTAYRLEPESSTGRRVTAIECTAIECTAIECTAVVRCGAACTVHRGLRFRSVQLAARHQTAFTCCTSGALDGSHRGSDLVVILDAQRRRRLERRCPGNVDSIDAQRTRHP